mmetsp:Transcript_36275/g.82676  ORF Transcript_36275/g.82676 Transcript_36275/m.82676 type:complete len:107 (-) Transcript_36275:2216-2536(-)
MVPLVPEGLLVSAAILALQVPAVHLEPPVRLVPTVTTVLPVTPVLVVVSAAPQGRQVPMVSVGPLVPQDVQEPSVPGARVALLVLEACLVLTGAMASEALSARPRP